MEKDECFITTRISYFSKPWRHVYVYYAENKIISGKYLSVTRELYWGYVQKSFFIQLNPEFVLGRSTERADYDKNLKFSFSFWITNTWGKKTCHDS